MKQNFGIIAGLAVATVCLTVIATAPAARAEVNRYGAEIITNGPQFSPGDRANERPGPQNVRDSDRYDAVVRSSASYRSERERKECGPIADPRMHEHCIASFGR